MLCRDRFVKIALDIAAFDTGDDPVMLGVLRASYPVRSRQWRSDDNTLIIPMRDEVKGAL